MGIPKMEVAPIHPFIDGFSIIYNLSILEIPHLSKAPYENIGLKMCIYIYILYIYIPNARWGTSNKGGLSTAKI
jgi:hypothetical protein